MNYAILTYGTPLETIAELHTVEPPNITTSELRAALVNAMQRIDRLEQQQQRMTAAINQLLKGTKS